MLSLKYQPGHSVSFLRMDKYFISWSYDSKKMLQGRVGEGMVKFSTKQFNMYFPLALQLFTCLCLKSDIHFWLGYSLLLDSLIWMI